MTSSELNTASPGSVLQVFTTFLKLGCTCFGGPIAHLGYFRRELVEKRQWVTESQYTQLLAICQFLPGPASSQLGFSLGLLRAGWMGAIAAFVAFTLPSVILLIAFASALPSMDSAYGQAAIGGLKIVALVAVADAVLGMSKKLCPDITRASIAALATCVLLLTETAAAQLVVVAAGALAGALLCRTAASEDSDPLQIHYSVKSGYVLLAIFFTLLLFLPLFGSSQPGLISLVDAFYRAGALVFGGGHVVLPLLQDSVVQPGWIDRETFLAGYGASQAIPGPMFSFSAYLGNLIPTGQHPFLGAFLAVLFIFLPGFLLIAGVLPLWKVLSSNTMTANAIAGINAAVVGLLAAALYDPIFTSAVLNATDLAIGIIGFLILSIWKKSPLFVVAWCVITSILGVAL
jgi:chromate transporter